VAESQKHKVERKLDPADPLTQAEEHCLRLGEDIAELGRHRRLIAVAYAKQGRWEDAVYVAGQIPGWQVAMAAAEIAMEAAKLGKTDIARAQLAASKSNVSQCTSEQADQVNIVAALACHRLNDEKELGQFKTSLSQESLIRLLTETRALESAELPDPEEIKQRMKTHRITARVIAGWTLMLARLHHEAGRPEKVRSMLNLAGELSAPPANFADQHALLDVARTARELGEIELAGKATRIFTTALAAVNPDQEWKAEYLADAATLLAEWDRSEEARKLMEQAAESAPKVFIYFAADAHLAVARGWLRLGDKAKAHKSVLDAARVAAATDHPRPRSSAAARICLFHVQESIPLNAEVAALLDKVKTTE
jgi:tetratricopeptide (TPR) repeat protein